MRSTPRKVIMRRQIHRETLAERRDANAGQYLIRRIQGKLRRRGKLKVHRVLQEQGKSQKSHHRLQQHQQKQKHQIQRHNCTNGTLENLGAVQRIGLPEITAANHGKQNMGRKAAKSKASAVCIFRKRRGLLIFPQCDSILTLHKARFPFQFQSYRRNATGHAQYPLTAAIKLPTVS